MSKKKTKLYTTKIPLSHPAYRHPGIYKYDDPTDKRFYIWYNIMSAQIKEDGTLVMSGASRHRVSVDRIEHYRISCIISPDHPNYAEFLEEITKYQTERFD